MINNPDMEIIPFRQIPPELAEVARCYAITLVGIWNDRRPTHCGSGTFVKTGNQFYILTANHCAKELEKCRNIGLVLRSDEHRFLIASLPPIYVGKRESDEWGVDLAFIPIDPVDVSRINASSKKMFYNLNTYEAKMLKESPKIENVLWAVIGTPAATSNLDGSKRLEFNQWAYSVWIESPTIRGDFDYLDIRVALDGENVPPNFKGLSGGGLWQAELERTQNDSIKIKEGTLRLEGCAFYETRPQEQYVYIRCHGRKSIYEQGLLKLRS